MTKIKKHVGSLPLLLQLFLQLQQLLARTSIAMLDHIGNQSKTIKIRIEGFCFYGPMDFVQNCLKLAKIGVENLSRRFPTMTIFTDKKFFNPPFP